MKFKSIILSLFLMSFFIICTQNSTLPSKLKTVDEKKIGKKELKNENSIQGLPKNFKLGFHNYNKRTRTRLLDIYQKMRWLIIAQR